MKRVLFVDDEKRVLDGLRRSLRPLRKTWEMRFELEAGVALQQMNDWPPDIVVSDIRMPGMDGVQFLQEVRNRYPEAVRIVLSGQADRQATMRLTGVAHQYLAKPCDPGELQEVVARAGALREKLTARPLIELVSGLSDLPSMPTLYAELMRVIDQPDSTMEDIASVVSRDPGMTAKILQLVNSSFFGIRRKITKPSEAASLLGIDTISALVLGHQMFSAVPRGTVLGAAVDRLYEDTMAVAAAARAIARSLKRSSDFTNECYLAGVLHDCGRLVLAANRPTDYLQILKLAKEADRDLLEVELEVLGATHQDVGAYLVGLWGLSDSVVEAAAFHHSPSAASSRSLNPLAIVHIARASVGDDDEVDAVYAAETSITSAIDEWLAVGHSVLAPRDTA